MSGGGSICNNGSVSIEVNYIGLLPWSLVFINQNDTITESNILTNYFSYNSSEPGNYEILLAEDNNMCTAVISGNANISVSENPSPDILIDNYLLYRGDTLKLELSELYSTYEWYNINEEIISNDAFINITDEGEYYVLVVDVNGCSDYSEISIINITNRSELYIPSSFSPNADMHNELFVIYGQYIKSFNLKILNKWGELLFESNDINKFWDGYFKGNKVKQDKYIYQIDLIGDDNFPFSKTGVIQVIY
jgi:gliding motility-associated-like protein